MMERALGKEDKAVENLVETAKKSTSVKNRINHAKEIEGKYRAMVKQCRGFAPEPTFTLDDALAWVDEVEATQERNVAHEEAVKTEIKAVKERLTMAKEDLTMATAAMERLDELTRAPVTSTTTLASVAPGSGTVAKRANAAMASAPSNDDGDSYADQEYERLKRFKSSENN